MSTSNGSAVGSLSQAIERLKDEAGGYDRFAAELGTSRQTVIKWVRHGVFPEDYVDALRDRGVPDDLLRRVPRSEVESRLRKLEAEIAAIRDLL